MTSPFVLVTRMEATNVHASIVVMVIPSLKNAAENAARSLLHPLVFFKSRGLTR